MRWPVHARLARPSALPTVWSGVLAGLVLAGGPVESRTCGALLASFSLFHLAGAYLNDAFDRQIDASRRPDRPIPAGLIGAGSVFAIGAALLGAAVLALVAVAFRWAPPINWLPVGSGVLLGAAITYYDASHARDPLSPLVLAACRVLVYVTAALAVTAALSPTVVDGSLVVFAYVTATGYLARSPARGGLADLWPLALLIPALVYPITGVKGNPIAAVVYVAFLWWVLHTAWLVARPGRPDPARAVPRLVAGLALLDAVLMASVGAGSLAGVAVVAFLAALALERVMPREGVAAPRHDVSAPRPA